MTDNIKIKQFVCLSGLPRTGSTLLSAILSQNPQIHAEGNSALCQLMWDMQQSCKFPAREQLSACGRVNTTPYDLISQIPQIYYKNCGGKIVIDKCRSWTIKDNIEMLKKYVSEDYKIIVLERPVTEVVKSFARLFKENNINRDLNSLLIPKQDPIMRSIIGLNAAKIEALQNDEQTHFLFITYNELIHATEATIQRIYKFCGWEPFQHDFNNVVVKHPENDEVYGIKGHHEIRPKVELKQNDIQLPDDVLQKCKQIDVLMGYLPRPENLPGPK